MGRESINDPIVIQSSIALLQERFRQLQRMKEMREERELLRKMAPEPKQCNPTLTNYEPSSRLFFHFLPPRSPPPPPPEAFSLWSGSRSKCMEAPLFASFFPTVSTETPHCMHVSLNDPERDDVDTTLHL